MRISDWSSDVCSSDLQAMALLDHERRHDALTGLSNRTRFLHELESLTEASADVVLAVADVDGFGAVNDMFGSKRGDSVLCEVAERLLRIPGPGALVGRLGSDASEERRGGQECVSQCSTRW